LTGANIWSRVAWCLNKCFEHKLKNLVSLRNGFVCRCSPQNSRAWVMTKPKLPSSYDNICGLQNVKNNTCLLDFTKMSFKDSTSNLILTAPIAGGHSHPAGIFGVRTGIQYGTKENFISDSGRVQGGGEKKKLFPEKTEKYRRERRRKRKVRKVFCCFFGVFPYSKGENCSSRSPGGREKVRYCCFSPPPWTCMHAFEPHASQGGKATLMLTCHAEAGEVDEGGQKTQPLGGDPPVAGQVEGEHVGQRRKAEHAQVVQLQTAVLGVAPPQIQPRQPCE